jgi:hypothetical protein
MAAPVGGESRNPGQRQRGVPHRIDAAREVQVVAEEVRSVGRRGGFLGDAGWVHHASPPSRFTGLSTVTWSPAASTAWPSALGV